MQDAENLAGFLYRKAITEKGHDHPATYAELLEIVIQSGTPVVWCMNPPPGFTGVEIRGVVFVTGNPLVSDHQRLRILAHEWAHALQGQLKEDRWSLYNYNGSSATGQTLEEAVAREFEWYFW